MTYHATAAEIAKMQGWSVAYVHKLASEQKWQRKGRAPVQFDLQDVARHVALTRPRRKVQDVT